LFRVQTQASTSECPVHENSGPTGGVFGSILSGEEFRILLVDLAEYVLRCALAKEPWRAVQGKGKSPSGIIVEYLGG